MDSILMQKAGLATRDIARIIATLNDGDRLPTVTQLSTNLETARGNIQLGLDNLKKMGAVELTPRGHLGTFVSNIDYLKLLQICGKDGFVGVMPLPYSKRYEGLATGIYSCINADGLRSGIAFMRGSENRIRSLNEGRYDFLVLSRLSFDYYNENGHFLKQICNLGDNSYVGKHMVIVRKGFSGNWDKIRVGIDDSSVDQRLMTLSYFLDKKVVLIPMIYNQIFSYLQKETIDAVVWNTDDMDFEARGFETRSLNDFDMCSHASQAVIACRNDDTLTARLLEKMLSVHTIQQQQTEVINEQRVPRY